MEWFKAFRAYIIEENQFQIFVFEKSDFFRSAQTAHLWKKVTY